MPVFCLLFHFYIPIACICFQFIFPDLLTLAPWWNICHHSITSYFVFNGWCSSFNKMWNKYKSRVTDSTDSLHFTFIFIDFNYSLLYHLLVFFILSLLLSCDSLNVHTLDDTSIYFSWQSGTLTRFKWETLMRGNFITNLYRNWHHTIRSWLNNGYRKWENLIWTVVNDEKVFSDTRFHVNYFKFK